jgi:hypothetical protein
MNPSLRRLVDIACGLAWAKAAWGIAALLVLAWIVGIAASVMYEPPLQVRPLAAASVPLPPAVGRRPSTTEPALAEENRAVDDLKAHGG